MNQYLNFDWKKLASVDLDKLENHPNHPVIQDNLENILNCDIYRDFDLKSVDVNFVKLFRLAQLAIRNQIDCQEYLSGVIVAVGDKLKTMETDLRRNEVKFDEKAKECDKLKKECLMRKSLLASQQQMIISGNGGPSPCPFCAKNFIAPNFLFNHLQKRHPDQKSNFNFDLLHQKQVKNKDEVELSINNEIISLRKQLLDYEEKMERIRKQEAEDKLVKSDKNLLQIKEMIDVFEKKINENISKHTDKTKIITELDSLKKDLTDSINHINGNQKIIERDIRDLKIVNESVKVVDETELNDRLEMKHQEQINQIKREYNELLELQKQQFNDKAHGLVVDYEEKLALANTKVKNLKSKNEQLKRNASEVNEIKYVPPPELPTPERTTQENVIPRKHHKTFIQHREICQNNLVRILGENNIQRRAQGIERTQLLTVSSEHSEKTKKCFKNSANYLKYRNMVIHNLNERLKLNKTVSNYSMSDFLQKKTKPKKLKSKENVQETQKRNDFKPVVNELVNRQKSQVTTTNRMTYKNELEPISQLLKEELDKQVSEPERNDVKAKEDDDTSQWSDIEELY